MRSVLYGLGIPEENILASDFRLLDDYARYQRARVQHFLRAFADDPPRRLLVLDDGAYMLEALAAERRPLPSVAIVEQTTQERRPAGPTTKRIAGAGRRRPLNPVGGSPAPAE